MAVYFDGTNDALVNTSWPVPDLTDGLTLACWFKVPAVATTRSLFGISRTGTSYESLYLQLESATLYAYATTSSNYTSASKGTVVANRWYHGAGTYASATSRVAWLNGVAGSVNTTSRATAGLDRLTIGKRYYNNSPTFGQANLAHVAVWRAILTATEMEWLYDGGRGIDPSLVRPDALICYYPLVDDYNCAAGPLHLTREDAPTWTNDSEQIILPPRRFFWRPEWISAPAGGFSASAISALPGMSQAAEVDVTDRATAISQLPEFSQAAEVDVTCRAVAISQLPDLSQAAEVTLATPAINASAVSLLPDLSQAAEVDITCRAGAISGLPDLTQAAEVDVTCRATVISALPDLSQAISVSVGYQTLCAAVSSLPGMSQTAEANPTCRGVTVSTLPSLSQAAEVDVTCRSEAVSLLPGLAQAIVVVNGIRSTEAISTLPVMRQSIQVQVGEQEPPDIGELLIVSSLPEMTQSAYAFLELPRFRARMQARSRAQPMSASSVTKAIDQDPGCSLIKKV